MCRRLALPAVKTVVFAPLDRSIRSMHRLPHRGVESMASKSEEDREKANEKHLDQWVARHLSSDELPEDLNEQVTLKSLADDKEITLEMKGEAVIVGPGSAKVIDRREASDGVLLVLDDVLDF